MQQQQHNFTYVNAKEVVTYIAPESLSVANLVERSGDYVPLSDKICPICHERLDQCFNLVAVKKCEHLFCRDCIVQWLNQSRKCPTCQKNVGEPQGKSPSGQMTITVNPDIACEGYTNVGLIKIQYILNGGKQKEYHCEEGKPFSGDRRTAYLPDNDDGLYLLKRLKYAFHHGLTFCIGTSLTSNKSGVITWASIHHKTSPRRGTHGWPDPNYFINCNTELDALGVPKAVDCT